MEDITLKEIENIGFSRYARAKGRMWWAIGEMCLAILVAWGISELPLSKIIRGALTLVVMALGFAYYLKLFLWDAPKAGKKFREEYEKERINTGVKA